MSNDLSASPDPLQASAYSVLNLSVIIEWVKQQNMFIAKPLKMNDRSLDTPKGKNLNQELLQIGIFQI